MTLIKPTRSEPAIQLSPTTLESEHAGESGEDGESADIGEEQGLIVHMGEKSMLWKCRFLGCEWRCRLSCEGVAFRVSGSASERGEWQPGGLVRAALPVGEDASGILRKPANAFCA
jgi:hypothetical protein